MLKYPRKLGIQRLGQHSTVKLTLQIIYFETQCVQQFFL